MVSLGINQIELENIIFKCTKTHGTERVKNHQIKSISLRIMSNLALDKFTLILKICSSHVEQRDKPDQRPYCTPRS